MMIEDLAFVADQDRGVPETSDTVRRTLVEADVSEDVAGGARLLKSTYFRTIEQHAFTSELCEEVVIVDWSRHGCL